MQDIKTSVKIPGVAPVFSGGLANLDVEFNSATKAKGPGDINIKLPGDLKGAADGALKGRASLVVKSPDLILSLPGKLRRRVLSVSTSSMQTIVPCSIISIRR